MTIPAAFSARVRNALEASPTSVSLQRFMAGFFYRVGLALANLADDPVERELKAALDAAFKGRLLSIWDAALFAGGALPGQAATQDTLDEVEKRRQFLSFDFRKLALNQFSVSAWLGGIASDENLARDGRAPLLISSAFGPPNENVMICPRTWTLAAARGCRLLRSWADCLRCWRASPRVGSTTRSDGS